MRTTPARLVMIGPGGAGKTTLSRLLAPMIGRARIDLDEQFNAQIEQVDSKQIHPEQVASCQTGQQPPCPRSGVWSFRSRPCLWPRPAFSSDNPSGALSSNRKLVAQGYSISILPAADLEAASDIIVERQLRRGFSKDEDNERRTIRQRFYLYKAAGDMLVVSAAAPRQIAGAVAERLIDPQIRCPETN